MPSICFVFDQGTRSRDKETQRCCVSRGRVLLRRAKRRRCEPSLRPDARKTSPAGCTLLLCINQGTRSFSSSVLWTKLTMKSRVLSKGARTQRGAQVRDASFAKRVPPAYVMISAFADDICSRQMIYPAGMIYASRIWTPCIIIPRVNASIQRIDPPKTSFRRQRRSASPIALCRALLYNQIDKTAECMFRQIREGRNDTACSGYAESFGR